MRINHNIASLNTYRQLSTNSANGQKSLEKLSAGLRINKAGDDAAGLAISEKMRGQIRGLDQAARNSQDAISLIQTAEGALNETHSILQRMRELGVQAANDTATSDDRDKIQNEIDQLTDEIDRIANTTQFNTKVLMKGNFGTTASTTASGNIDIASAKESTITAGTYSMTVGTAAAKETWTGTVDIETSDVTITAGTNDTLVLNGVTISFNAGTNSDEDIVNKINEFTSQTHITATMSGNNLQLIDTRFGSNTTTATGNAKSTIFSASTGTHTTTGADATVYVAGTLQTATADDNDGRSLTITSGALKGIDLNVAGAATSAATLSITKSQLTMQIGANEDQTFGITLEDMGASSLGVDAIDVTSSATATAAISTIDDAIKTVSSERSKLGAYQNRLEHTINNLSTSSENLVASESRIRDVDMAKEMMEFTKNNILSQAAQAMLAQANQQPQGVLQLLR